MCNACREERGGKRGGERRQRCERGGGRDVRGEEGKGEEERVEGQLIYKGKGGQIEEKNQS